MIEKYRIKEVYTRTFPINLSYDNFPSHLDKKKRYFSNDWFAMNRSHLVRLLSGMPSIRSVLEIGCFEGRSTLFFLDVLPEAQVTVIDPFLNDGTSFNEDVQDTRCLKIFLHNTEPFKERVHLKIGKSEAELPRLEHTFDLIYVDGSHMASTVLQDLLYVGSDRLTHPGSVIIMDDYMHKDGDFSSLTYLSPGVAIDTYFRKLYPRHFSLLYKHYSIAFRKEGKLRPLLREEQKHLALFHKKTSRDQKKLHRWKASDDRKNAAFWK